MLVVDPDLVARTDHLPGARDRAPIPQDRDQHRYDPFMGQRRHVDLHQLTADELAPIFLVELEEIVPGVGEAGSRGELGHDSELTRAH